MPDPVLCPHCGSSFSWKDEYAGRRVRCRECAREFAVPPAVTLGTAECIELSFDSPPSGPTTLRPPPGRSRRLSASKVLLLVITALWLFAIVLNGAIAYFRVMNAAIEYGNTFYIERHGGHPGIDWYSAQELMRLVWYKTLWGAAEFSAAYAVLVTAILMFRFASRPD